MTITDLAKEDEDRYMKLTRPFTLRQTIEMADWGLERVKDRLHGMRGVIDESIEDIGKLIKKQP